MFKTWLTAFVVILAASSPAHARHQHPERWYQERWCRAQQGRAEVRLVDRTRVDCLTATHAVEVDFARKLYEAIGQSLHYSMLTGKRAGILLILERPGDEKYWRRLRGIIRHHDLEIDVWRIAP